jgi:hypothetical protein
MTEKTHWQCPMCRHYFPFTERVCPTCKVTQVRPRPAGGEEPAQFVAGSAEISFPHVIPDARFSLPTDTGATWASGPLVVAEGGIYLLSSKDNLTPETVAKMPATIPGRLGALSFAIPVKMIKRILHDKLKGQWVELEGKKIPLRLDVAGWKALDACCDRLGIPRA